MEALTGVAVGGIIQRGRERKIKSTQTPEKDIWSLLFFKLTLNEHTERGGEREKSQDKTWKIDLGIVSQGSLRESPNKIDYYYFWLLNRI